MASATPTMPSTMITPSLKKEVLCVVVLENSVVVGQEFPNLFHKLIDPILRHLRKPVYNQNEAGTGNSKVTPLVRFGLVYYGHYSDPTTAVVNRTYFVNDYRLYRKILTTHRFPAQHEPQYAVTEGLTAALELFDLYAESHNAPPLHTLQHCILVTSRPSCTETARNNLSPKYDGYSLVNVINAMKQNHVHLSVIALPSTPKQLVDLPYQVADNKAQVVNVAQSGPATGYTVKLTSLTPPSLVVTSPAVQATPPAMLSPIKSAVRRSSVTNPDSPITATEHTPPARKRPKVDNAKSTQSTPGSITSPPTSRADMSPALTKKSTKGKGDTTKTPKLKSKAKPKATSASPKVSTSILEFSPVMVASKAPAVTSPLITSTTVERPSTSRPETQTQPLMTNLKNQAKIQEKRHAVSFAQQQLESLQKRQDSLRQMAAAQKTSAETSQAAAVLQALLQQGLIKAGQPIPPEVASRLPPALLATIQAAIGRHAKANAPTPAGSMPLSNSPTAAMTSPSVGPGVRLGSGPNTVPQGVQTPSSSVQSATSSQEAISAIQSPANRLTLSNTPTSQPVLGAYSQVMSNAMYTHYIANMAGNQNPTSMAQLNTQTHSPAMAPISTPVQHALYVNAQTMSPSNPSLLPRMASQNSNTGEALLATNPIWMGKLLWVAKDRTDGTKFTHNCLVSASPGSHEIRRSMRELLGLPATPADNITSPATSPFNLVDFQLSQWPKDLQTRQLMSVNFDKLLRYIVENHSPFVEFSSLPNQENVAASNNYRSLLSNLGMKPMAAFIPFTNSQEATSPTQTPGMFLIFHTKLIGVLSLTTRIPYEVLRAPAARPDEGQANSTQLVSPLNTNISPQVLLQTQNQLLATQPSGRPPNSVAFSNTLTAASNSQAGNAAKLANNSDLTTAWMHNITPQQRSALLQQLRQATQNSTGTMNPSPQVQVAQFMAQQLANNGGGQQSQSQQQQQQQLAKNLAMGSLPGNPKTAGGSAITNSAMSTGMSGANNSPQMTQALQQMLIQNAARTGRPLDPAQVAAWINNNSAGNPGTTPTSLAANATNSNPMLNKQRMNVGNVALLNSLNNTPGNPIAGNPLLTTQGNTLGNASLDMNPTNMLAAANLRPGSAALNSMLLLQQNRQQLLANMAVNNPALNTVGSHNNNPGLTTVNPGLSSANMRNMALPSGNFALPNGPANGGQMLNQQLLMQLMQQQQQQQSNQQRTQIRPPGKF